MNTEEDAKKVTLTERQRKAAKFLADMGGSQPDLAYIPRRQSELCVDPEDAE